MTVSPSASVAETVACTVLDAEVSSTLLLILPLAVCQTGLASTLKALDKVFDRPEVFVTLTPKVR